MMVSLGFLLDRLGPVLLVFAIGAGAAYPLTRTQWPRVLAGFAALGATMIAGVSRRSLLEWCVSATDRLSISGLAMLFLLAMSAVTGRGYLSDPQYRFASAMLAISGLLLYPSAVGLIDYDAYGLGYHGILLPAVVAAVLAYAIWRRYWVVVAVIDIALAACVLGLGRSLNLFDYLIDPVAAVVGALSWVVIAAIALMRRAPAHASGETPMSHS